jgi:hypothetical protein
MQRITEHQAQQGFMTIAQNTVDVDYLRLAYLQAMSIKLTMPGSLYAVAVDEETEKLITDKHRKVFDYVVKIEEDHAKNDSWKMRNEWQLFYITPFKETIKLESDLIITRSIAHWWNSFRLRDLVLSTGCRDYLQNTSSSRVYRKVFDDNMLPDVYNGLMYFRYAVTSAEFFRLAEKIFINWEYIRDNLLKNCRDEYPTTDLVYALTSQIIGEEITTLPKMDFINFVHMKAAINGFTQRSPWQEMVFCETEAPMVRINNTNQYHPLHYHEKNWVTDDLLGEYEYELGRRI